MAYPVAFFEPQVRLARLLAERVGLTLADALLAYTTAARSLGVADEEWSAVAPALLAADDLAAALHATYERCRPPDPQPGDTSFHGRPLFGCFSYAMREGGVIRPHFVANDLPGRRPLGAERISARRDELRRLFAHVQAHVPDAMIAHRRPGAALCAFAALREPDPAGAEHAPETESPGIAIQAPPFAPLRLCVSMLGQQPATGSGGLAWHRHPGADSSRLCAFA